MWIKKREVSDIYYRINELEENIRDLCPCNEVKLMGGQINKESPLYICKICNAIYDEKEAKGKWLIKNGVKKRIK